MDQKQLFLLSDAALRATIDDIRPDELDRPAPAEWSRKPDQTIRDIIATHTRDEAWVPDVLAGSTIEEVGSRWDGDLLGDDPIASYDHYNDLATAALEAEVDLDAVAHLSYGDHPVSTFLEHTSYYRAFQAWAIAHYLGRDIRLPDELVVGLRESIAPQLDQLREWHVFPPEVEVPAGSDAQTQLLGWVGFYVP